MTCYVQSFENAIQRKEYYCEVKTIDTFKGQVSKITKDNLIMEKFEFLCRKLQSETLEIISYKIEKKINLNFQKKFKRLNI